jgi:hypothetical protein
MAERALAHTIEVEASHSIALSQPAAVADLIRSAVRTNALPDPAEARSDDPSGSR